MIRQQDIKLPVYPRGAHLITSTIEGALNELPQTGLVHLMVKHTSAGLTINENVSPGVRTDLETFISDLIPEDYPAFTHTSEGPDDMPAHIKSSLIGAEITIPITNGQLNLGTWQGIYFCEFRDFGGNRTITATILS